MRSIRIIRCQICDISVETTGNTTKYCKECARGKKLLDNKKWQKDNEEYYKASRVAGQRDIMLRLRYDITHNEYLEMLNKQDGVCYLCRRYEIGIDPRTGKTRWLSVDHSHSNGNIRKLLCAKCNKGLGAFNDDPDLMQKAVDYLRQH